jgi:hypothetical protein
MTLDFSLPLKTLKTRHLCGFRGSTYGPAGPVKQYTREEIQEYERRVNDKQNTIDQRCTSYNVIEQRELKSDGPYKAAFVDFIKSKQWHWFITIPPDLCDNDDEVLHRLRSIEATFCGRYLVNRYHKLPDEARYSMVVAFEGEAKRGTRHAHILAYVPPPTRKGRRVSHSMVISLFTWEFAFLWIKYTPFIMRVQMERPWEKLKFGRANTARAIYTVKDVRQAEVSWSRFEFVTPPKWPQFNNENLSVIRNRDQQRRAVLGIA